MQPLPDRKPHALPHALSAAASYEAAAPALEAPQAGFRPAGLILATALSSVLWLGIFGIARYAI